ncbi:unnamed protein product [Ectocarpus sp. 12 AP-2014]
MEPSPTPPPPLPPPPPPRPPSLALPRLSLSSMQVSLCNFLGVGRSPKTAVNFVEKDLPVLEDLQCLGLTKTMRALDGLRKHNATKAEESMLGANGRLDTQDRAGLLTLCGCQRGCRLTSDEMKKVQRVTRGMADSFASLELQFETLAPKIRGDSGDNHQHELGAFFETADKWLAFYDDVRALVVRKQAELRFELPSPAAALRGKTGGVVRSSDVPERLPAAYPAWLSILLECYRIEQKRVSAGEDSARSEASGAFFPAAFHHPADSCQGCQTNGDDGGGSAEPERGLQQASSLDNADSSTKAVGYTTTSMGPESTEESKITPISTTTAAESLVERNSDEKRGTGGRAPECAGPPMDSLVSFSRYLALLVASAQEEHTPSANECERSALAELLRASDDGSDRGGSGVVNTCHPGNSNIIHQNQSRAAPATGPSTPVGSPESPRPLRYWARRIHRFLLSVRELRMVPDRDLASLEEIMLEARRGGGGGRGRSSSPPRALVLGSPPKPPV